MNSQTNLVLLGIFALVFTVVTVTFAAPSAELQRTVGSDVVADTTAAVQLIPSDQYGMVQIENDGTLSISPSNVGADGINSNANLVLGSRDTPSQDHAFRIENPSVDPAVYNLRLEQSNSYTGTATDVQYVVQKNTQTPVTIDSNGQKQRFTLQSGDKLYITVDYNTQNIQTGSLDTTFIIKSTVNIQ